MALFALGVALLVGGSEMLVRGASRLAVIVCISPLVVGLSVVAFATSSPELAVCVQSAFAGNGGLAIGNVIGSNLFNILFVLGLTAWLAPGAVPVSRGALAFLPVMIGVALARLPVFFLGGRISRWEGALFLDYYAAYTAYRILMAGQHAYLPAFRVAMVFFVLPLTAVTLLALVSRKIREERRAAQDQ